MNRIYAMRPYLISAIFMFCLLPDASLAATETVQVRFENSCKAEVQSEFNHGVTMLHLLRVPGNSAHIRRDNRAGPRLRDGILGCRNERLASAVGASE